MSDLASHDVVVIGEGPAGVSAALAYAKQGKRVALVAKSPGAASVSSGAWDFGNTDAWRRPLVDWREAPTWQALTDYAAEFARELEPTLRMHHAPEAPLQLAASDGSTRNVYAAQALQASVAPERLRDKKVALISAPAWRWQAEAVAARWTRELLKCEVVNWEWGLSGADWPLAHVAARLRDDAGLGDRLLAWLKERAKDFDCFLFPPIFLSPEIVDRMEKELPRRWGECLATVEPTAGARLQAALRAALAKHQIISLTARELKAHTAGRRLEKLAARTVDGWRELSAHTFVLATGRYLGGGLTLWPGGPRESLLNLPLYTDREHPLATYDPEIFRREPAWRQAGVWIDERCRPIGSDGKPAWENVQACGSLIGGVDYVKAGLGIGYFIYQGRQCALVGE